ncbi:LytR/AlgR family response regulator transcription factor [Domibacillus indicus]|uniref:LytR/AlgR family response regulator transcription factor n=1 Tax=Domibacillus indicus TaxID=1437523 RepID=UPI000A763645
MQVAGEADSGEQAVIKSILLQPDAVLLDIEMPGITGLEAAEALRELKRVPEFVFATAYPQFAAEAFCYEAVARLKKKSCQNRKKV